MTEDVLSELRRCADMEAIPSLKTVRRWIAMLEADGDEIARDAREQAKRDAA